MSNELAEARYQVALANRMLAHEGVLDAFGHVSMRHPGDPGRYLLSRSRSPGLIEPDDVLEFTLDSEPVKPPTAAHYAERVIHGCIYQARPEVMAVVHHHAPAVLPFCIAGVPIAPVFHLGAAGGETVPFWNQNDEFGDTNLLVVKPEEGQSLARALGPHNAVLLNNHGAVVVGARSAGTGLAGDLHVPERRVSVQGAPARQGRDADPRRNPARQQPQRAAERDQPDLGILDRAARQGRRPAVGPGESASASRIGQAHGFAYKGARPQDFAKENAHREPPQGEIPMNRSKPAFVVTPAALVVPLADAVLPGQEPRTADAAKLKFIDAPLSKEQAC